MVSDGGTLAGIRSRHELFTEHRDGLLERGGVACCPTGHAAASDVPALVAEVERLTQENTRLRAAADATKEALVIALKTNVRERDVIEKAKAVAEVLRRYHVFAGPLPEPLRREFLAAVDALTQPGQPLPIVNDEPLVKNQVITDIEELCSRRRQKYGTDLQPHNGRDALVDLYEELIDAVLYLKQLMMERTGE